MVWGGKAELREDKGSLNYYKALHDIANQIHSAKNIDDILINLKNQILGLFDADRVTIYVVEGKKKEIYSQFKSADVAREIRVPINDKSIAGYTVNNAQTVNVANAYDRDELIEIDKDISFDRSWDESSGYLTKQILSIPILYKKYVIGVLQLINKKHGDKFSPEDEESAEEMAKVLGIAFYNHQKLTQTGKKRTKFTYLIENNIITEKELERAIKASREKKAPIESIFINEMKVRKQEVGRSLAEYYECEYIPFDNSHPIRSANPSVHRVGITHLRVDSAASHSRYLYRSAYPSANQLPRWNATSVGIDNAGTLHTHRHWMKQGHF